MTTESGPPVVIVMGVAGSGKTTVGALLSGTLGWTYAEADDFHPPANVAKMAAGHPLDDADRLPWLRAIGDWIDARHAAGEPGIVSCSGLKRAYRDLLRDGRPQVRIVFLEGSRDVVHRRMVARHGHFMRPEMLDSQFADLELPTTDEHLLAVSVEHTPTEIVRTIIQELHLG
jgi:gluconokinase